MSRIGPKIINRKKALASSVNVKRVAANQENIMINLNLTSNDQDHQIIGTDNLPIDSTPKNKIKRVKIISKIPQTKQSQSNVHSPITNKFVRS